MRKISNYKLVKAEKELLHTREKEARTDRKNILEKHALGRMESTYRSMDKKNMEKKVELMMDRKYF